VATGSERGNSADVTMWREEMMYAVSFTEYETKQSFVSSGYELFNVKRYVAQTAFKCFTEESIYPAFVTFVQLTSER